MGTMCILYNLIRKLNFTNLEMAEMTFQNKSPLEG